DRELGSMGIAGEIGQEIPQYPIEEPWARSVLACAMLALELLKGDLELVEPIVARFVHTRRLTGGPDEKSREKVRQRRMVLPVGNEALQKIGAPQQWTLRRRRAAERDMVAAAGARVPAVEHEFLGAEPRVARL